MFKTDKTAKLALIGLMLFFGAGLPSLYFHGAYKQVCLMLGLELVYVWGYLNPWILQEKYSPFFIVDTSKMVHLRFLFVGGGIVAVAALSIFLDW